LYVVKSNKHLAPLAVVLLLLGLVGFGLFSSRQDSRTVFAQQPSSDQGNAEPKVTIWHAAGQAGTTHYVTLTL
jgi:hypothetical protein